MLECQLLDCITARCARLLSDLLSDLLSALLTALLTELCSLLCAPFGSVCLALFGSVYVALCSASRSARLGCLHSAVCSALHALCSLLSAVCSVLLLSASHALHTLLCACSLLYALCSVLLLSTLHAQFDILLAPLRDISMVDMEYSTSTSGPSCHCRTGPSWERLRAAHPSPLAEAVSVITWHSLRGAAGARRGACVPSGVRSS